jgi:release factor glutamine methyltransferase
VSVAVVPLRERLDDATARLTAAGVPTPRVDAEWLLADALGVRRAALYGMMSRVPPGPLVARYETAIRRRVAREPLQHIVGSQAFCDVSLAVGPDVLVPRPETELLVSWALELLPSPSGRSPRVLEVGTGSGCIAAALASERRDVTIVAGDISPAAVAVARDNIAALGFGDRVTVMVSDLFSALPAARVDLIVSNPPYITTDALATLAPEITQHEPRIALDGGPDGLAIIARLVREAPSWLRPGAALMLETGGDGQIPSVMRAMRAAGLVDVASRRDLAGVTRFVSGRRAVEAGS